MHMCGIVGENTTMLNQLTIPGTYGQCFKYVDYLHCAKPPIKTSSISTASKSLTPSCWSSEQFQLNLNDVVHSHIQLTEKCAAREVVVRYEFIQSCQKSIIYPFVCHPSYGALLYTLVVCLLLHVSMYCPWVQIHLVQCFRYICVTAIALLSLLKPPGVSAVMMLHHYCHKTTGGAIMHPSNMAKRTWIISLKPPVLQLLLQKTLFSLDWVLLSSFSVC